MNETFDYFQISQKSRYALRALLQMALLGTRQPVAGSKLAASQKIPSRFLEVILNELRQGGFVRSIRGKHGGYILAKSPHQITVGQIIRFLESASRKTPAGSVVTEGLHSENWLMEQINSSISQVLDSATLEDMAAEEQKRMSSYIVNYVI